MDKYINGSLVKRVLVFKTRKHPDWVHYVNDYRFLVLEKYIEIIWYYWDPCFWNLYGRKNDFIFREKICLLQGWNSIPEAAYYF